MLPCSIITKQLNSFLFNRRKITLHTCTLRSQIPSYDSRLWALAVCVSTWCTSNTFSWEAPISEISQAFSDVNIYSRRCKSSTFSPSRR